jgi:hypothetical protein
MMKGKSGFLGRFLSKMHLALSIFCLNMKDMKDYDGFLAPFWRNAKTKQKLPSMCSSVLATFHQTQAEPCRIV